LTDKEIVDAYWARNEDAIRQTQLKYGAYLTSIADNVLANREDSEECVNDGYLAAWHSMPTKRPENLAAYLGRLVRQIAIDLFRRRHAQKRYASEYAASLDELEDIIPGDGSPENSVEAAELAAAISRYLQSLPEQDRQLFLCRYYFFDSLKKAAAACGLTESGAKSRLHRMRLGLRDMLEKEGYLP